MNEIVVLSGKGGTGKTTVLAALAYLASMEARVVLADADVDAANLGLLLSPTILEKGSFVGGKVAVIAEEQCTACSICGDTCRFDAIRAAGYGYQVDPVNCEGCAACFHRCPTEAIRMEDTIDGEWNYSQTRLGPLFHAHLSAGRENSGKLVTALKQKARALAQDSDSRYLLIDGPPGIGCPVIASCSGANVALLVAEPTVSGLHDLYRIIDTTRHFGVQSLVCINKWDIQPERTQEIERACAEMGIEVVGKLPFDTSVTMAMMQGKTITEYQDGIVARGVSATWSRIKAALEVWVC